MKLLIITPRIPDVLDKGDKLRIFHQIKFLSNFHKIDLICLEEKEKNKKLKIENYIQNLYTIKISKIDKLFNILYYTLIKKKPVQVSYYYSKKAQKKIDYLIKKTQPDWLYCQLIRSSEYIKSYKQKKVIDYMDSFSLGLKRRMSISKGLTKFLIRFEYKRVKKYETNIFNYFNAHTIISDFDKKNINHIKNKNITVVPNGIDTTYFSKNKNLKNENIILFVGNMNYPPNILAAQFICKEIFPIINNKKKDFKIIIAGSNPHKEVIKLQKINSKIQITGFINDIRDVYKKASIFIAPMFIGSGLQNKLLEAMSMKIPCITTDLANNSLNATKNEIIIANNKYDFANECLQLLNNSKKRFELGKNGHTFVNKNFSWKKSTEKINNLFK